MNWFLVISVIAGGWGQVYYAEYEFPSQAACHEALGKTLVQNPGQVSQGERGQTTIVRCVPKAKK
jgi:hypothetical protein